MNLEKGEIITLDNDEEYIISDLISYNDSRYFFTFQVKDEEKISSNIAIFEEVVLDEEVLVERVIDRELLEILIPLFKEKNTQ